MTLMFYFKPQYGPHRGDDERHEKKPCVLKKSEVKRVRKIIPRLQKFSLEEVQRKLRQIELDCQKLFKDFKREIRRKEEEILHALGMI